MAQSTDPDPADEEGPSGAQLMHHQERGVEQSLLDRLIAGIERFGGDEDSDEQLNRLAYERLGPYFRDRSDKFEDYRRTVNEARLRLTWDRWLALTVFRSAILASSIGFLSLCLVTIAYDAGLLTEMATRFVQAGFVGGVSPPVLIGTAALLVVIPSLMAGLLVAAGFYYYPQYVANERARQTNRLMPDATTYMFAKSRAGMNIIQIVEDLAENEGVYGPIAEEMQVILANMQLRGRDFRNAVREARDTTPSDELSDFFDSLLGIVDQGSDVTPFLRDQTERYQRRAEVEAEQTRKRLQTWSRVWLIVGVIFILFLVVVLTIAYVTTGSGKFNLKLAIYGIMPLLSLLFGALLSTVLEDQIDTTRTLPYDTPRPDLDRLIEMVDIDDGAATDGGEAPPVTSRDRRGLEQLIDAKRRRQRLEWLEKPIIWLRFNPWGASIAGLVVALIYLGVAVLLGIAPLPIPSRLIENPIGGTTAALVVPALITLIPGGIFYEWERRSQVRIREDLSDFLKTLASANESGMTLAQAFDQVAETSDSYLANRAEEIVKDLQWNMSISESLTRFANVHRNQQLTRVMNVLIETNSASGDIRDVLRVTAKDSELTKRIQGDRERIMQGYVAKVIFVYLLFLLIVGMFVVNIVPKFVAQSSGETVNIGAKLGGEVNVDFLNMLFYHSMVILAICSGLVAGKLKDDHFLSGVKIVFFQLVIAVVTFHYIIPLILAFTGGSG